jgi:RimJ/RimL family protein N-acetyltransferase
MFAIASRSYQRWMTMRAEHGSTAGWQWLVDRVGARLVNLGVSEVVWLELADIKLAGDPPEGFEFRWLTPDEVLSFVGEENELSKHHAERVAAGHDLCFAALHDGRLAGYGWYALGSIEAVHCDNTALSFPSDVAYMYKGFTHPDFRGLRLHGFAMRLALEALAAERGVTKLVSTVGWLNFASLKSCDRLGYRRLGRMTKIGWGAISTGYYPAAAKQLGVRFGRRADLSNRR